MAIGTAFLFAASRGAAPQSPQTKKTKDRFERLIAIGEGPIKGLHDGLKSFYLGDTPVHAADDSPNFTDIDLEFFPGDDVPDPVNFTLGGESSSTGVGVLLLKDTAVNRTTPHGAIDAIEVRLVIQALYSQNNDGLKDNSCQFKIEYKAHSGSTWVNFTTPSPFTVTGQFTGANAIEFRKAVPRLVGDTYDLRVTKLSAESTTNTKTDIAWESFQEVINGPLTFPNTALVHLVGESSNQFSGLPQLKGIYDGLLCQIPTNYNPYTRVYTGSWDGTFKTDWTNNNAWIFYNVVMNSRWGLNAFYPAVVDKFDCYDASLWCDALVPDGKGGTQPRFTFNAYITEPMNGKDFVAYVASSFNGVVFDDLSGSLILRVDKDADAVALFTPENVVNGHFEYSYSDENQRYNDVTVTFLNPDLGYQPDRRRVFDQSDIDLHGSVVLPISALGVTDAQQAIRLGYSKMIPALTEKESVTFATNRLGAQFQQFEIILVADPDMGYALSGRIKTISVDRKTITLRDAIHVDNGVTYAMEFETENGVLSASFTAGSTGAVTSIVFASALPAGVEVLTTFSLGGGSSYGLPKPYRVMQMTHDGIDQISIIAVELNRAKWDAIDEARDADVISYADRHVGNFVAPVGAFSVPTQETLPNGDQALRLNWTESPDLNLSRYRVEYSKNGAEPKLLTETVGLETRLSPVEKGTYTFYVYALNLLNFSSQVATQTVIVDTATTSVPAVTGLEIEGQGHDTIFTTKHAKFTWRLSTGQPAEIEDEADAVPHDPLFKDFLFEIIDNGTGKVVFTDWTQNPFYIFTYDLNVQTGGPRRSFLVRVRYRDIYNRSSLAVSIIVSNPPPAKVIGIYAENGVGTTTLNWPRSTDIDQQGYQVWLSNVSGFSPGPSNLAYDGPNNRFDVNVPAGSTMYARVAAYDFYDTTTVNISDEFQFVVPLNSYLESALNFNRKVESFLEQFAEIQTAQIYTDTVTLPGLVDGINASITTERTLRASDVAALAELLTQVTATANDTSASALFRATAVAAPAGVAARIALQVRATSGDSFEEASIFLDAMIGGGSQITLSADRIALDGTILTSGGILTNMLGSNAATSFGKMDFSGINSVANTAFHDLTATAVSLDLTNGQLDIDLTLNVHNNDAGDHGYQIRILKDGVVYKAWPASGTESHNAQKTGYTAAPFYWHDQDTGVHVYKAQFACPDSNTNLTFEGTLRLTEIKR